MCIHCCDDQSNDDILIRLKNALENPNSFPNYNLATVSHIIYASIGINGEECQTVAKKLLSLFRDWYKKTIHRPLFKNTFENYMWRKFAFCPNTEKFSDVCDFIIAFNDEQCKTKEFKDAFFHSELEPKFKCIPALMKSIEDLTPDPKNFEPIIPTDSDTFGYFCGFFVGIVSLSYFLIVC